MLAPPVLSAGRLTRLRVLSLQHLGLTAVDVRGMAALELLDLRHNSLTVGT